MTDKASVVRGPKDVVTKTRAWTRSMTTGTQVATLPKGSRLLGFVVGGVASDAQTTATLSIGNNATATQYVAAQDVKTAAAGAGPTLSAMVSGTFGSVVTVDTPIFFKYAETGTAATVGGGFVDIRYSQSNIVNNDA